MNKQVWKYALDIAGEQTIAMPIGAQLLTVGAQQNGGAEYPYLWALVDPVVTHVARRFRTYGTGHDLDDDAHRYVGSYQLAGGAFVGHLFEIVTEDQYRDAIQAS